MYVCVCEIEKEIDVLYLCWVGNISARLGTTWREKFTHTHTCVCIYVCLLCALKIYNLKPCVALSQMFWLLQALSEISTFRRQANYICHKLIFRSFTQIRIHATSLWKHSKAVNNLFKFIHSIDGWEYFSACIVYVCVWVLSSIRTTSGAVRCHSNAVTTVKVLVLCYISESNGWIEFEWHIECYTAAASWFRLFRSKSARFA